MFTETITNPHFNNLASIVRVPFRSAAWRAKHPEIAFWSLNQAIEDAAEPWQRDRVLSAVVDLLATLVHADPELSYTDADITWLIQTLDSPQAKTIIAMWRAWYSAPDETTTPAEVAAATATAESTWRNKAAAGAIPGARKAGKQWLLPLTVIRSQLSAHQRQLLQDQLDYVAAVDAITAGEQTPEPSPTDGETFYYISDAAEPLISLGRVPGKPGVHILRRPDGALTAIGGYYLRRPNELWEE